MSTRGLATGVRPNGFASPVFTGFAFSNWLNYSKMWHKSQYIIYYFLVIQYILQIVTGISKSFGTPVPIPGPAGKSLIGKWHKNAIMAKQMCLGAFSQDFPKNRRAQIINITTLVVNLLVGRSWLVAIDWEAVQKPQNDQSLVPPLHRKTCNPDCVLVPRIHSKAIKHSNLLQEARNGRKEMGLSL